MRFPEWLMIGSMLFALFIGIWGKGYKDSIEIFLLLVSSLIIEIIADFYMIKMHRNNLFFYHGLTIIHFGLLSKYLLKGYSLKYFYNLLLVVIIIEVVLIYSEIEPIDYSPSHLRLLLRIILLVLVFLHLEKLIKSNSMIKLVDLRSFWIVIGIISYFANFMIVGLMKYLIVKKNDNALTLYEYSLFFDAFFYLVLGFSQIKNEIND